MPELAKATLLVASNNQGKIQEYGDLLQDLPLRVTWPAREGLAGDPEETGATFEENALIKARYFARLAPCYVIADDSGLEVDALGGAPGIYSARFAGPGASDAQRNQLLLARLQGVPSEKRAARFQCVIALVRPDQSESTYCGTREGCITLEPRGDRGFGYDPVFFVPELGKTFGELEPEIKNRWSHRAQAAARLLAALKSEHFRPS
ncbi:MAG: RdgB/HAM1 family non-canonical purine NTP pyrophosphatase [Chloroflexi bacterium]|nr:RdgB/HAM1 family non-canonical purine NTP pyrophosphatase [Chloroflexota bacterium]